MKALRQFDDPQGDGDDVVVVVEVDDGAARHARDVRGRRHKALLEDGGDGGRQRLRVEVELAGAEPGAVGDVLSLATVEVLEEVLELLRVKLL